MFIQLLSNIKKMKYVFLTILASTMLLGCDSSTSKSTDSKDVIDSLKNKQEIKSVNQPPNKTQTDLFNDALRELYNEFKYKAQSVTGKKLYRKDKKELEQLVVRFKECSNNHALYDLPECEANFDLIRGVKNTFIKAEKPFEGQLYLKAYIQEWEFKDLSTAKDFETAFNKCRIHSECVNKGGIIWWRVQNRIYTIETPAYRYSFEFDKIKEVMNRKLNENI